VATETWQKAYNRMVVTNRRQRTEASMKKSGLIFILALVLAAGAIGARSAPSYAQVYAGYNYPPPPQNIYATPWVGSNTPWTFYQGDWFLKGVLYNFFGPHYGWAPYYAYPPTYIVRPVTWYEPRWHKWYQGHPHYWQSFQRQYPYWRGHQAGQRYDQTFYNRYHRGQGAGWNQGFHGVRPTEAPGHGVRPLGAPGPGAQAPGRGVPPAQAAVRDASRGFRTAEAHGPGVRKPVKPQPNEERPQH
jgi:hypothetical protein